MHLKRPKVPKTWPIPRKKGGKFVIAPDHALSKGLPITIVLRDLLKIAQTRKETQYICRKGFVKINGKVRKKDTFPMQVFDTLTLEQTGENYRLEIVNRKFVLKPVSAEEAEKKIVKIVKKTILPKKKVQMNLDDGQNFITDKKFSVGDSAIINTTKNQIESILPLKKGAAVEIIAGKHAGKQGVVEKIEKTEKGKKFLIKLDERVVELPFKTILVVK